jgi:hypothetical protein
MSDALGDETVASLCMSFFVRKEVEGGTVGQE